MAHLKLNHEEAKKILRAFTELELTEASGNELSLELGGGKSFRLDQLNIQGELKTEKANFLIEASSHGDEIEVKLK